MMMVKAGFEKIRLFYLIGLMNHK